MTSTVQPQPEKSSYHKSLTSLGSQSIKARWNRTGKESWKETVNAWWHQSATDGWLLESLALVVSLACLAAVFILLASTNRRKVPETPSVLTLNTIVSILVTASTSLLLLAVSAAINQWRWLWFKTRETRLYETQVFDDASRGPVGAINLLGVAKWRDPVAIGALVVLLSSATNPFAQQVISYPLQLRYYNSSEASIKYTRTFTAESDFDDELVSKTINNAFWNGPPAFPTYCSTGNCTWPPFETLSWCTSCEDLTRQITPDTCSTSFNINASANFDSPPMYLPCALTLNEDCTLPRTLYCSYPFNSSYQALFSDDPYWLFTVPQIVTSSMFTYDVLNDSFTYWDPTLAMFKIAGQWRPALIMGKAKFSHNMFKPFGGLMLENFTTCTMAPCLRKYNVSVQSGMTKINILDTQPGAYMLNLATPGFTSWVSNYTIPENSNGTSFPSNGQAPIVSSRTVCGTENNYTFYEVDQTAFYISTLNVRPFASGVAGVLQGNITSATWYRGREGRFDNTSNIVCSSDYSFCVNSQPVEPPLDHYSDYSYQYMMSSRGGLEAVMADIATSLTVMMANASNTTITGQVGELDSFVRVQWVWLIYPFVVITIFQTRRHKLEVWKVFFGCYRCVN